jgi:hypothetical protein
MLMERISMIYKWLFNHRQRFENLFPNKIEVNLFFNKKVSLCDIF